MHPSVQCVGIHWNSTKLTGYEVALRLIGMLRRRGVTVCVNDELAEKLLKVFETNDFDDDVYEDDEE